VKRVTNSGVTVPAKSGCLRRLGAQDAAVAPHPVQVVSGLVVPKLRQLGQGLDHGQLDLRVFLPLFLNPGMQVPVGRLQFPLEPAEFEVGADPGPQFGKLEGLGDVVQPPSSKARTLSWTWCRALRKSTGTSLRV
jgi:hypothetical protein